MRPYWGIRAFGLYYAMAREGGRRTSAVGIATYVDIRIDALQARYARSAIGAWPSRATVYGVRAMGIT